MAFSLNSMFGLKGKVALVTGGNGGIGLGIVEGLAGVGADIVIAARNEAKTEAAVAKVKNQYGVKVIGLSVDVVSEDSIKAMLEQAVAACGRIDILVNNAGMAINKFPAEMTTEEWNENINVNLRSVFICSREIYPHMKSKGGGKIINIGSMFAIFGAPFVPAYSASKGGVVQLTKTLAISWAPDNIQVNAIMPGFINTDLSAGGKAEVPGLAEAVEARTPLNRWGEPEDCAGAVVFLASPASDFVTGALVPVDGGYSVM